MTPNPKLREMIKRLEDLADYMFAWTIIAILYLTIAYDYVQVHVREAYYKMFSIPYYKGQGKFGPYITRLKE
jgi:hypothetical protein